MPHSKQRYLFIDLLRFLAVIFMIQGHTFDALLDFGLRTHTLFFVHDFFHGFIAPMFLFASGVAFGISTFKRWEEHIVPGERMRKRFGKFAGLLVIGYTLHLPFFSLTKVLTEATPAELAAWLQVDALHCIAVTMLVLQSAVFLLKDERKFVLFTAILAAVIIFLAPVLWSLPLSDRLPLWFASYLNMQNSSWFPLFPWSAYILCGVIYASVFIRAKEHHQAARFMQRSVAYGLAIMAVMFILVNIPMGIYPSHDVWKANPLIVFARMGFVAVVIAGVFFAEHSVTIPSRIPQMMGRESLFIYIIHLVIIYGSALNKGLQQIIGPVLNVLEASSVFIAVLAVISLFTYGWYTFKLRYKTAGLTVKVLLVVALIVTFFLRPY
ncbi:MAG: DUF1624 domain-containing protein [Bacteroidetes bacterium]|nr:DUF1624 domain-containing protein [Bacteroidota bacterium]